MLEIRGSYDPFCSILTSAGKAARILSALRPRGEYPAARAGRMNPNPPVQEAVNLIISLHEILVCAGAALLFAGLLLTWLLRRRQGSTQGAPLLFTPSQVRLRIPMKTLRMLRSAQRTAEEGVFPEALRRTAVPLTRELLLWRSKLRRMPSLPAGSHGLPRVFIAADAFAASGRYDAASMSEALAHADFSLSSLELAMLPGATAQAAAMRLQDLLRRMQADARDRRRARRLAARMAASRSPMAVLERQGVTRGCMNALLSALRDNGQEGLAAAAEDWLEARGTSAGEVALRTTDRRLRLAGILDDMQRCLQSVSKLNWLPSAEAADPLHALLSGDPAGIYPRMTVTTRLQYRMQAGRLAALCRMSDARLAEFALEMAKEAPGDSAEAHVGHFLMTPHGQDALIRAAGTPAIRLRRLADRHGLLMWRGLLLLFSAAAGTAFINAYHPLIIAPFFLIVLGMLPRSLFRAEPAALPAMELPALTDELRTLVVLPAELTDASSAVAMVRRLAVIRRALPRIGADCMLLGDFTPGMTQQHAADAEVIGAVNAAIAALEDDHLPGRYLYLQRSRSWDEGCRTYAAKGGAAGAVRSVCRLIAQGECADELAYSSVSPAFLHRHYAFVLVVMPDAQPVPGMLEKLLSAAAHPLCTRMTQAWGKQGVSMLTPVLTPDSQDEPTVLSALCRECMPGRVMLLRPDAFLDDTDGMTVSAGCATPAGCVTHAGCVTPVDAALCGHAEAAGAHAACRVPATVTGWLGGLFHSAALFWQGAAWQLPFVQTPGGFVRNPLKGQARFRLREQLRMTLLPISQAALLLWAAWSQRWWLTALAVLAPELGNLLPIQPEDLKALALKTAFIPARAAVQAYAAFCGLCRTFMPGRREAAHPGEKHLQQIEAWSQGLCATACAVFSLSGGGFFLPAALLAGLWGCFPLLHTWADGPLAKAEPLTDADASLLYETAAATWRFLSDQAEKHALPPEYTQHYPRRVISACTSPRAIAGWLLSCACAPELGLAAPAQAAAHLLRAASAIARLPMPHGLPCRSWNPDTMTVQDPAVDAADCGLLLCALTTAAQAAREWLPRLPPSMQDAPARLDQLAQRIDVSRLFDRETGLFHRRLDADGQGHEHILHFHDEGLLLSVYACASGMIPASHFAFLSHARIRTAAGTLPLTRTGSAPDWLLPELLLPMDPVIGRRAAHLMQRRAVGGIWGTGRCAYHGFSPAMTWLRASFSLPEAAGHAGAFRPVFTPWAAALCLPHLPHEAALSLQRMREQGLFGPQGFFDAIDMTGGAAVPCALLDTFHQGILLCACAHVLADAPLRRYFTALPAVQACLPLLTLPGDAPVLPRRPALPFAAAAQSHAQPPLPAEAACTPADAHVVGGPDASALVSASGSSAIFLGGIPATRFHGDAADAEGPQFYLVDEGRAYRVNDPFLSGETRFSPGEARFTRLCGSLQATLTVLCDPADGRIVHVLEIVNLSTADRIAEAADCLVPDLNAAPFELETARPDADCLTARSRASGCTLYHRISCSGELMHLSVCTEETAFTGRSGSMRRPVSLDEPIGDPPLMQSGSPCLSFRARFALSGRGRITLIFTTALTDTPPLAADELPGVTALSALQGQALAACAPMTREQMAAAALFTGALLWRNQPHQVTEQPTGQGREALAAAGIDANSPFAALLLGSQSGLPLLRDALAAMARLRLCGIQAALHVFCPEALLAEVRICMPRDANASAASWPQEELLQALTASAGVTLRESDGALHAQLVALRRPLPRPRQYAQPRPGSMPKEAVLHPGGCGGFDPENGDYLIMLPPGMTTPAPWPNLHVSRLIRCTADETGLHAPFEERVFLVSGDTLIDPAGTSLPRIIRQGAGFTRAQCRSDRLSIALTAACMPGHSFALRRLRIRNTSGEAAEVTLTVVAAIGGGTSSLSCIGRAVFAQNPDGRQSSCITGAGEGWQVRRGSSVLVFATAEEPSLDLPDEPRGDLALMTLALTIAPGASADACWLSGYVSFSEQAEAAAQAMMNRGASDLLREVRQLWSQRLGMLTVRTPESSLDLLFNRILPCQVHGAARVTPDLVPALALTDPRDARACLLACAAAEAPLPRLPVAAAHYLRITDDQAILDKRLPGGVTLAQRLTELMQKAADHASGAALLQAAAGAEALTKATDGSLFRAEHSALLRRADRWLKDRADASFTLEEAAWTAILYGLTARTRRICSEAWRRLYDREHGVLSAGAADEQGRILPGFAGNGGQDTLAAAWFLAALIHLHEDERAWELLLALNPVHHTDDPLRTEEFRLAPWLIPAHAAAYPGPAGQALPGDGAAAAAWLYITAAESMLGLIRRGDRVTWRPRLPRDWESFTVTLLCGSTSWHFAMERSCTELTVDGEVHEDSWVVISDDGRMHHVRVPMK